MASLHSNDQPQIIQDCTHNTNSSILMQTNTSRISQHQQNTLFCNRESYSHFLAMVETTKNDRPVPLVTKAQPARRVSGVTYFGPGSSEICFVKKYQALKIWTYLFIMVLYIRDSRHPPGCPSPRIS